MIHRSPRTDGRTDGTGVTLPRLFGPGHVRMRMLPYRGQPSVSFTYVPAGRNR